MSSLAGCARTHACTSHQSTLTGIPIHPILTPACLLPRLLHATHYARLQTLPKQRLCVAASHRASEPASGSSNSTCLSTAINHSSSTSITYTQNDSTVGVFGIAGLLQPSDLGRLLDRCHQESTLGIAELRKAPAGAFDAGSDMQHPLPALLSAQTLAGCLSISSIQVIAPDQTSSPGAC